MSATDDDYTAMRDWLAATESASRAMSSVEDARAEAERRYPALQPDDEDLTYPRHALREFRRASFLAGVEWAASRAVPSDPSGCVRLDSHPPEDCFPPPAVPSDHTATTEDTARALVDHIEGMADSLDDHVTHEDVHRLLIEALGMARGLLATARPDTTEAQAQALEAAADRAPLVESYCGREAVAKWLRKRAAAIREGADK